MYFFCMQCAFTFVSAVLRHVFEHDLDSRSDARELAIPPYKSSIARELLIDQKFAQGAVSHDHS